MAKDHVYLPSGGGDICLLADCLKRSLQPYFYGELFVAEEKRDTSHFWIVAEMRVVYRALWIFPRFWKIVTSREVVVIRREFGGPFLEVSVYGELYLPLVKNYFNDELLDVGMIDFHVANP